MHQQVWTILLFCHSPFNSSLTFCCSPFLLGRYGALIQWGGDIQSTSFEESNLHTPACVSLFDVVAVNDSVGAVNRSLNARISGILPGFSFLDRQVILSFIAPTYLRASTKRRGQSI